MGLLEKIDTPLDLRKLAPQCLANVATEIRQLILKVVAEQGGHFASNLGAVELTIALHYAFDTPSDKIVWDVGHQSYPHKILTGRRKRFETIRQKNGLSGFTSREESLYDHFGAGHASTSISAALGIAEGLNHQKSSNLAIAVIGDGALTGGLAFEALNNAGHISAKNLIVVLNDNDMSIDPNVGALARFINHTLTHRGYNRLRREIRDMLNAISKHGFAFNQLAGKIRRSLKNFVSPGMLFECFGFRYFGPIDGHNIDELLETFSFIKSENGTGGPYLVHVLTKKGKGYKLAEKLPLKYHGVNPFSIIDGIALPSPSSKPSYQDVFADTLIELAKHDEKILAITAAMPSGTGLSKFQEMFPHRCYDVGIAEAHAVVFAAGLATEGFKPVVAIYSTFLQRAYDQIIHDVGLQNLPVIFAMDRAGLVGADGATHQGAFDLSYLRAVPNFVIMAPKDENELRHMLRAATLHSGPIALRYPRGKIVGVLRDETPRDIAIGKGECLGADSVVVDICLVGIGVGVQIALRAALLLRKQGYLVTVINARFVKPLDKDLLLQWAGRCRLMVSIEENSVLGGFGSAVIELLNHDNIRHCDILQCGIPDEFIDHATPTEQRKYCGLDTDSIVRSIMNKCPGKSNASSINRTKKTWATEALPVGLITVT